MAPALLACCALFLTACGDDKGSSDPLETGKAYDRLDAVTISGDPGSAPEVKWKGRMSAGKVESKTITQGDGDPVKDNDNVLAHVWVGNGYSRQTDPDVHAEEAALATLAPDDPRLATATLYSTLEPCSQRRSRPRTCTQLILAAGIPRVVIAWREPGLFVADCQGYELLSQAGVEVVELAELGDAARAVNAHLAM